MNASCLIVETYEISVLKQHGRMMKMDNNLEPE